MKQPGGKKLVTLAALAIMFCAETAFAAAPVCSDWLGKWSLKFEDNTTDNVTLTSYCNNTATCTKLGISYPIMWNCVAEGKKQSNNKNVQIRKISFSPTNSYYYELTDTEISSCSQNCPSAEIPDANYNAVSGAFTVSKVNNGGPNLVSGHKSISGAKK